MGENEEKILNKLDEMDSLMVNFLDKDFLKKGVKRAEFEGRINKLLNETHQLLTKTNDKSILNQRYKTLLNICKIELTNNVLTEEEVNSIEDYNKWLEFEKRIASGEKLSKEEVDNYKKFSEKTGHQFNLEVKDRHQAFVDKYKAPIPEQIKSEALVISDIHGNIDKWNTVLKELNKNPSMILIIEGDAMDRGAYGLQILLQIKELCDRGKAIYLPGNHDVFAYNTLKTEGTKDEKNPSVSKDKIIWQRNGGEATIDAFKRFDEVTNQELQKENIHKKITKKELIEWLGKQPIQMKFNSGKINYALSHAVFDTKLYNQNPKFNLEDALNLKLKGKESTETFKRFMNCMWYREKDESTHFAELALPKDYAMVCGHTKQEKINYKDIQGNFIMYIDCGKGKLQGFNLVEGDIVPIEEKNER